MAIAFDTSTVTTTDWTSGTTKSTPSFTVANVSNRVMVATLFISNGDNLTSLTWNGSETFTLGAKVQNPGNEWVYLYYLNNPTATTSTVDAVASIVPTHSRIDVAVYNGAATPLQFSSNVPGGSVASLTDTLTIGSGSWIIGGCGAQRDTTSITNGTIRQQAQSMALGDTNGAPGSGSQSIIFNFSAVQQVSLYAELPTPAVAVNPGFFIMM